MHKSDALLFNLQELSVVSEQIKKRSANQAVSLGQVLDPHMSSKPANSSCFVLSEVLWSWIVIRRLGIYKSVLKRKLDELIIDLKTLLYSAAGVLGKWLMIDGDARRSI